MAKKCKECGTRKVRQSSGFRSGQRRYVWRCPQCTSSRQATYQATLAADGLCRSCGQVPALEDITRCAECKAKHNVSAGHRKQRKALLVELMGSRCAVCGDVFPPCVYDFHHIDPSQKSAEISKLSSWEDITKELKKCVMLCANCHRIMEYGES